MPGLALLTAFLVAALVAALLLLPAARRLMLGTPDELPPHARAAPRTGGIAIAAGVGAACMVAPDVPVSVLVIAAALAVVSFADDLAGLPALLRMGMLLAAAAAVVAFEVDVGIIGGLFLVIAIAWCTIAYTLMDGADGLAAGMTVLGFGAYALAALHADDLATAVLCASIASAGAAFLLFNWHPARLSMGGAGSVPIGFLAGALGVSGWSEGDWPLWFPALVFAPFLVDATLTLARRARRRERLWQPHGDHYYQRLVGMGLGHRRAALLEYGAMAGCVAIGLAVLGESAVVQALALAWAGVALLGCAVWIDYRWKPQH